MIRQRKVWKISLSILVALNLYSDKDFVRKFRHETGNMLREQRMMLKIQYKVNRK